MGLQDLYPNTEPAKLVQDVVGSQKDRVRRMQMAERVRLYRDDYQQILCGRLAQIFREPQVYLRIEALVSLVGGTSFLKRVCDELGRPLYAQTPQRRIVDAEGKDDPVSQAAWIKAARSMALDVQLDLMARLVTCCNTVFGLVRYLDDLGLVLEVMTPNQVSVVPHPMVATRAAAISYVTKTDAQGRATQSVVWDDRQWFTVDGDGKQLGAVTPHPFGCIPILEVHRGRRWGEYWDVTTGEDLVAQTKSSMLYDLIVLKKIKAQSHRQLTFSGDTAGFSKDQVSDEESVLMTNGMGKLDVLNLESDPTKVLAARESGETVCAANYGISRDRLNQKVTQVGDDVALRERVEELAQIMAKAEREVFQIGRAVLGISAPPEDRVAEDAKILVDLGDLSDRVDRMTQLQTRREAKSQGIRSAVDDVLDDNPEFGGDRDLGMKFIDQKLSEQALVIMRMRALNIPENANIKEPGQMPETNGRMGPAVRDGIMTRDQAAAQAKTGPMPTDAAIQKLAMSVLTGDYRVPA